MPGKQIGSSRTWEGCQRSWSGELSAERLRGATAGGDLRAGWAQEQTPGKHVPAAAWEQAAGAVAGRLPFRNAILPVLLPVRSLSSALLSVQPSQSSPQSACLTAESLPSFVSRINPLLLLGMGESVCGSGLSV